MRCGFSGDGRRKRNRVETEKQLFTETQGLELVLGVGERCTVTSAIQRPGSGHLRGSEGAEKSIMVSMGQDHSGTGAVGLFSFSFLPSFSLIVDCLTTPRQLPLSAPVAHAQLPVACQPLLTVSVLEGNEAVFGLWFLCLTIFLKYNKTTKCIFAFPK